MFYRLPLLSSIAHPEQHHHHHRASIIAATRRIHATSNNTPSIEHRSVTFFIISSPEVNLEDRATVEVAIHRVTIALEMTVRDALNSALDEEMSADSKVFLLGEEVRLTLHEQASPAVVNVPTNIATRRLSTSVLLQDQRDDCKSALQLSKDDRTSQLFSKATLDGKRMEPGALGQEENLYSDTLNYSQNNLCLFNNIDVLVPPVLLPNSGIQTTQLGHVKDLATAFIQVLGNEKASKEVFNIAGDKYVTFDGLARAYAKFCTDYFPSLLLGMAVGAGTDVAIEAADTVLI